jgi:AAA domain
LIRERRADLVIIDPVMAFLPPEVASNNDQCVRRALGPLARLAERTDCTILLVRHLRKRGVAKALYRGLGSIGFVGSSRAALMVAPHPVDRNLRVLALEKPNLAGMSPALGFRLREVEPGRVVVEWTGPLDVTADDLGLPAPAELRPRDRATDWLIRELANGPRKVTELLAAAAEACIPEKTLKRAKAEVGVKSHQVCSKGGKKDEGGKAWYWYDPCAAWPADAPFKKLKPGELPPLEDFL